MVSANPLLVFTAETEWCSRCHGGALVSVANVLPATAVCTVLRGSSLPISGVGCHEGCGVGPLNLEFTKGNFTNFWI